MVPTPRSSDPSATASSRPAVVMGLAVGIHRSKFTSRSRSSAYEDTDLVGGLRGGHRLRLPGADRQGAVDLLAHEHDGPLGVQVRAEVTGGHPGDDEVLEHPDHV